MAQTPDETRREIEETRFRIAEAAEELEERIEETTDWRKLVSKYPLESFAAALGIGLIVSGVLFRSIGRPRAAGTARVAGAGISGVLSWVRPIITPVITARLVDYMRRRSE